MPKAAEPQEPLVVAAIALMDDLARYASLTDEVRRIVVNSEKTLGRASRAVQEAAGCHDRIMEHVGALSAALLETRERQESYLAQMAEVASKVSERATTFQGLVARYGALAELAKGLNVRATEIAALNAGGAPGEALAPIGELLGGITEVIAKAEDLTAAARGDDFDDLAPAVDALKQQMQSVQNRISLARRALADRAPS